MQKPACACTHVIFALSKTVAWRPCCGDHDQAVQRLRSLQNLWSKALNKKVAHSEAANRRARFIAIMVNQMGAKVERLWERQRVCAAVDQVVGATDVDGTLHMHQCRDGNGNHDEEWHRHAQDHGRQLIGVMDDGNVARCFKNKNEVTEHQATARTKTRSARESVNLAMQSLPRRKKEREDKKAKRRRKNKEEQK